jgi:hypothetical protein
MIDLKLLALARCERTGASSLEDGSCCAQRGCFGTGIVKLLVKATGINGSRCLFKTTRLAGAKELFLVGSLFEAGAN